MESQSDSIFANSQTIELYDQELWQSIAHESVRQEEHIELIASENYASQRILEAQGSVLTNKYAEGYPHKRYYGGCEFVDIAEELAISRAKELFKADYANVQPHSGAQANMAVMLACLKPGDTFMGLDLSHGGHLSHGSAVNSSGILYNAISYEVIEETGEVDYDMMEAKALEMKPKLIIAGASAYSRDWDYERMRAIADKIDAILFADISHPSGLIAKGLLNDPVPYCHIVTTTTHKTLRGPRGGLILMGEDFENPWGYKTPKGETKMMSALLNSAVFPGIQGGPLMHVIAGKAVAFLEALKPEFKIYKTQVIKNAQTMAESLSKRGVRIISGRTESHVFLVDLRPKGLTGKLADVLLGKAHITVNKNSIPNDPESPFVTSGIRIGSPAITTRGFKEKESDMVAQMIADILDNPSDEKVIRETKAKVVALTAQFPVYGA